MSEYLRGHTDATELLQPLIDKAEAKAKIAKAKHKQILAVSEQHVERLRETETLVLEIVKRARQIDPLLLRIFNKRQLKQIERIEDSAKRGS